MLNDIWQKLSIYESRDLVAKKYHQRHGRETNLKRLLTITANFVQAREYFYNAQNADIAVRPLLQYYGVLGLTKGLILFVSKDKGPEALKPAHGLEPKGWNNILRNGLKNIGKISVVTKSGTFSELIEATQNKSYFKHNSSAITCGCCFPKPDDKSIITFSDIASRIVDASAEYTEWVGTPPIFAPLSTMRSVENSQFEIKTKNTSREALDKLFPTEICTTIKNGNILCPKTHLLCYSQKYEGALDIGEIYFVLPLINNTHINTLGTFFVASYFLGMMARYFPSEWILLSRQVKGDGVFPLIRRIIDLNQNIFPLVVLEFLQSPYSFGTKANLCRK